MPANRMPLTVVTPGRPARPGAVLALAATVIAAALACSPLAAGGQPLATQPGRGRVVADTLWSQALGIRKQVIVWLPPSYAASPGRRYPVAYYLHGFTGDEWDWVRHGHLDATLDSLSAAGIPEMIVVMPDGDDSWYTTWNWLGDYGACLKSRPPTGERPQTYCVPWPHYDDYIARDLVAFTDRRYRTIASRNARGIAGLSMGGYGAIALALEYPDVYSAAASHSGVLSPLYNGTHPLAGPPHYAASGEELRTAWGDVFWTALSRAFGKDTAAWWARDPARRAGKLKTTRPALVPALKVDVGTEDALADESRAFRAEMERLRIPLQYDEYPGAHTWEYWRRHAAESATWLARRLSKE